MRVAAALLVLLAACAAKAPGPATGESGALCGGIAALPCNAEGDYCAMDAGACVRIADSAGMCKARPEICTMQYEPVCGCDGRTYPNACRAASQGVNVAHDGACAPAE